MDLGGLLGHVSKKPTHESPVDFSYLKLYGTTDTYHIPTIFEHYNYKVGEAFLTRVSNIYDPSKFWIVPRFQEYEAFQTYLFRFYFKNRDKYKIPRDKVQVNMYCVVFADQNYYRGVIVSCPPSTLHNVEEVKIHYFDFGMVKMSPIQNLYYMNEDSFQVPQFAVRACLAAVRPSNKPQWTNDDVIKFNELVMDKILSVNVIFLDTERQLLKIYLCDESLVNAVPVHETLVLEGLAKYFNDGNLKLEKYPIGDTTTQYLYLYPSHEALERGIVASKVYQAEMLATHIPATNFSYNQ